MMDDSTVRSNVTQLSTPPVIKVFGVGGGGNNALNNMIAKKLPVEFVAVNTDTQALRMSKATEILQIGANLTKGMGAGANPTVGHDAAEESEAEIKKALENVTLLFITAGMGGGTGTGAAPVIARIARKLGILTIAVVTTPFDFEGKKRMENAQRGIYNLRKYVDTILVISNEQLLQCASAETSIVDSFMLADDVLCQGIQGISDLIKRPYLINLDFADIKTTIKDKGYAHMGIGMGEGPDKIYNAIQDAVGSKLITSNINGADSVIMNVVGGKDLTLKEFGQASNIIKDIVDPNANMIIGAGFDESLTGKVKVTFIATGFDKSVRPNPDNNVEDSDTARSWKDGETSSDVISRAIREKRDIDGGPREDVNKNERPKDEVPQQKPDSRFDFGRREVPPVRPTPLNYYDDNPATEDMIQDYRVPPRQNFARPYDANEEIEKPKQRQRPKFLDFLSGKKDEF